MTGGILHGDKNTKTMERLTMTPALECAPMSHASNTENKSDVATPPNNLPIMRILKSLKSAHQNKMGSMNQTIKRGPK